LWVLALGLSAVYGIELFFTLVRSYFLAIAVKKSDIIMSAILFERVLDLKISNKPKSAGSFASNLKEVDTVRNFFSSASLAAIGDLPFALIFLIVTYSIGSYLVLVPIVVIIAILCFTFVSNDPLPQPIKNTF
ncbi:ABC transporter transmembrane domain-containing protein, partial [Campylobacter concisus]|uniref:ABC transporter transmembrane domain-containing protein n=1 Tax=Campylobacter concisus TaxID=199 RepID=UPI0031F72168